MNLRWTYETGITRPLNGYGRFLKTCNLIRQI
jgi:hypothetical protein